MTTSADDRVLITPLAERPELAGQIWDLDDSWPVFVVEDLVANAVPAVPEWFPQHCVVATDGDRVVARGLSVPFNARMSGREELPDGGWDRLLVWALIDRRLGRPVTTAGALEVTIDNAYLGRGLSHRMLAALRETARARGLDALVAPVRPNGKHLRPHVPMSEYVRELRPDGLPEDPWLRVHVRAGGTVEKIAPASMTVSAPPAQWRAWTGLPFDRDGDVVVPGALVPVHCDLAHDHAVYVEPNVWVRHRL
ncbi:hypothetical protein [Streptomyces albus]|uniref:hypothetical protein n=1 Tax=Streptomyces albus TaxID=1888 RepID=UPI0006E12897|nr:hypothetical protein [Streptomyces albus]